MTTTPHGVRLQLEGPTGPRVEAATVLACYIVVLLAIPAALTVPALGTAGAPSSILALGIFLWWLWDHLHRVEPARTGFQPLAAAIALFVFVELLVYVHAVSGPFPVDELTPADSGMIKLFGWAGVALVASEGIQTPERFRSTVRKLVIGVGLVAALGVIQYVTKEPWVNRIRIPGFSSSISAWGLATRDGLSRPSGTSTHPIEFGVVLTMALPLVIVHALHAPSRRWFYRLLLGLLAFSIFLSISRSAILCAAVALIVLAARWTWRMRLVALGSVGAIAVFVFLTVPGLMGTITGLFTGLSGDTSVASRTGSYTVAGQFIERSPWLGRGLGTFLPKYWILDNGYLGLLIDSGIVGLVAFLVVIVVALRSAHAGVGRAGTDFDKELAYGLLAAVLAGATAMAFYDMFSFPQSAGCLFLIIGLAGRARWLHRDGADPAGEHERVQFGRPDAPVMAGREGPA